MENAHRYWFRAKRYGWGWGLPLTWEGWVSLVVFVGLIVADIVVFAPHTAAVPFIGSVLVLGGLFTAVCWLKGEPARWRWGGE